jgi:hypothetical protein
MVDLEPALIRELDRIAPAEPEPEPRWRELRPRHNRARIIAVALAVVIAAAIGLTSPWQRGPASLSSAEAARVVQRAAAALAPRGGVLHVRIHVTVASPYHPHAAAWSGDEERWTNERGAQSFRLRTTFPNLPAPLELGGSRRDGAIAVYDPSTATLYSRRGAVGPFVDPVEQAKRELRGGSGLTVRRAGNTYRIEDDRDIRSPTVLVVDAKTYRPIREISTIGSSAPFALYSQKPRAPLSEEWQTVAEYRVYEYVSDGNLASIHAQHPHAKVEATRAMPRSFRSRFQPWTSL